MQLRELSDRSGVSTATIKYYLREGLLPPGRRVSARTSDYDETHLRRLRLVRALIQIGKVPVSAARDVLAAVDDESLSRTFRLGAALWALPHGPDPDESDPDDAAAYDEVDALLERLGWARAREIGRLSPAYRTLTTALAALKRLGRPVDVGQLTPYARHMAEIAVLDLDNMEEGQSDEVERVEAAVVSTVLFEPVLTSLRRLAQEEESTRRYGL